MAEQEANEPAAGGPVMVPAPIPADKRPTAFDRAIRALIPRGTRTEILALFDDRVTWDAIRHWRTGKRGPPQWAIDRLRERAATVAALQAGPGTGGALMAWLRAHGRLPASKKQKGAS